MWFLDSKGEEGEEDHEVANIGQYSSLGTSL